MRSRAGMSSRCCRPAAANRFASSFPRWSRDGLTVVVSPLIALMKDQVDALQAGGIAGDVPEFLARRRTNRGERLRGLHNGEYRLLYVAPERLMLSGFLEDLQRWNVQAASRWTRRIASANGATISGRNTASSPSCASIFPSVPIMALTATATERVREDIVKHLQLREPQLLRRQLQPAQPDLSRRWPKTSLTTRCWSFVRARPSESGIIYCQRRKAAESVAERSERGWRHGASPITPG